MATDESAEDLTLTMDGFRSDADGMSWRWSLTGPGGVFEADAEIRLRREEWQYDAFEDLYGYLAWRVDPERRTEREAAVVREVGEWIGARVLGEVGVRLARFAEDAVGCTVRVTLPQEARTLAARPLEAAVIDGVPLRRHGVVFVHDVPAPGGSAPRLPKRPVGAALRILALFSLPDTTTALDLRRERHELARIVRTVSAVHGRAVELRVLQYGVTRRRLREIAEDGRGWDIVHVSAHGGRAVLTLEHEDGSPDEVPHDVLVDLLSPLRRQVKLITASSCSSADDRARDSFDAPGLGPALRRRSSPAAPTAPLADLASSLAGRLDCAVVGMRFPVVDDFAIALSGKLYESLLIRDQPLATALALALASTVPDRPTPSFPALSAVTPALFGRSAAALRLSAPPSGPLVYDAEKLKLAGFLDQPARFVGRVGLMSRANAALAPRSKVSGIVLHGMAGSGKTTAALELAYMQEDNFQALVWLRVGGAEPADGELRAPGAHVVDSALTDLAITLERKLKGLSMTPALTDREELHRLLPLLTEFFERRRVLLVIDNAEALLTSRGTWRDERWEAVYTALTSHTGLSRTVLTSRVRPASTPAAVSVEPVHALGRREAILLARELPRLGQLIEGSASDVPAERGREVVSEVLAATGGHPELLVLADAQATDLDRLGPLLDTARRTREAARSEGAGIGKDGGADAAETATAEDYAILLDSWTRGISGELGPAERTLFQVLSVMEEADRGQEIVTVVWNSLNRSAAGGSDDAPVAALVRSGLVAQSAGTDGQSRWDLHPSVAGTGRASADPSLVRQVEVALADHWCAALDAALAHEDTGRTGTEVLRAGRAACPYLLRSGDWEQLVDVVSQVLARDLTRPGALALLPFVDAAVAEAGDADRDARVARTQARVLLRVDPAAGELRLTELFDDAVRRGDHERAANLASDLRARHRNVGRLAEALTWAERAIEHIALTDRGPWTKLGIEAAHAQLLAMTERFEDALERSQDLLNRSGRLSRHSDVSEGLEPWTVEEMLLDVGRLAARGLGRLKEALDFNKRIADCESRRDAPVLERTHTLFNTGELLLSLGQLDESAAVFQRCRQEYERQLFAPGLAWTFTAFARVEHRRGHGPTALGLARDALRYAYRADLAADIVVAHHDMGVLTRAHDDDPRTAVAHLLAAELIEAAGGPTDGERLPEPAGTEGSGAGDGSGEGDSPSVPGTVDEVIELVGRVPGVDLRRVLTAILGTDAPPSLQALLEGVRASARPS
ncbi:NB-ARC domain-containing protein [Streptomyces sp. NPDC047042]|uniref:NB-ARC domain-containing protein n=1 Tax=Streptomyces sp. NPDC047042 TaxID=3154807 RepID=UPI0033CA810C